MVTGQKAFQGKNYASLLGAILSADPPPMSVKPFTPSWLERLVRRCLQKDPDDRWQSMRDLVLELRTPPQEAAAFATPRRTQLPWAIAAGVTLIAVGLAALHFTEKPVLAPETRVDIVTPPTNSPDAFALSPDGRKIAYVATTDGLSRLWVRPLDSISAQLLPGTENALNPFWSPDSRSLGFFADSELKRIDLGGGQPQNLTDVAATTTGQGAWGADGTILFTPSGLGPLRRIPAAGGQSAVATRLGNGEAGHSNPRFLVTGKPGGKEFLFRSLGAASALWLDTLDDGGEPRRVAALGPGESAGEYLAPGWMARVRGNALTAQRFDAVSGRLSGDPVAIAQTVGVDSFSGAGAFSVAATDSSSRSGQGVAIAWRNGTGGRRRLFWFNRAGQNVGAPGAGVEDPSPSFPEISPDGKRVAFTRGTVGSRDLWIHEGARTSRFTLDPADDFFAIWSPDGARVVFTSNRKGPLDLYQKEANGSGSEEPVLQSAEAKRPNSWSPDGRFILYWSSRNNGDLMVLPMTGGDRHQYPFLSTPFNENQGVFSPDGKWVAYASNESGRYEIYVRPFPGPGGKWQVSTGGGTMPRWRPEGGASGKAAGKFELYYHAPDQKLMAVTVAGVGGTFVQATPEALFPTHMVPEGTFRQSYDVGLDGRFLIVTQLDDASSEPIHLLLNWRPPGK
jgi:Tol biopolymer transport system component